ncbi:MAG: hypothetical protein PHF70_12245 [Opitutales bacterium]|nr:hypothetical protein [Opitutales bacterium]
MFSGLYSALVLCVSMWSAPDLEMIHAAYDFQPEAFAKLEENRKQHPDDAFAAFLYASACFWLYLVDEPDPVKRSRAALEMEASVDLAERDFREDPDSPDKAFLYGVSLCNVARFYLEEKSWWSAYRRASRGLGVLDDLIRREPEYYDAYFAVGVSMSFLDDVPLFLRPFSFLMGVRGDARQGMKYLELAREKGTWTEVESAFYMGYYYFSVTEDAEKGKQVFDELGERFPGNPAFAYFSGRCMQLAGKPLEAALVYEKLWPLAWDSGARDMAYECRFRLGEILRGEHRYADALVEYMGLHEVLLPEYGDMRYAWILPLRIGQCQMEAGNPDAAMEWLDKAVRISDSKRDARRLMKELARGNQPTD